MHCIVVVGFVLGFFFFFFFFMIKHLMTIAITIMTEAPSVTIIIAIVLLKWHYQWFVLRRRFFDFFNWMFKKLLASNQAPTVTAFL